MPVCLCLQKPFVKTVLFLLCLIVAVPVVAKTPQQGGDKPPPSATIVSITDLPDTPARRKKGSRHRAIRLHGRATSRRIGTTKRFLTVAQRRKNLQLKQRQLATKTNADRVALQKRVAQAQQKPNQIAQKITEKQNTAQAKATPPQVALKSPPVKVPSQTPPKQVAQQANTTPPQVRPTTSSQSPKTIVTKPKEKNSAQTAGTLAKPVASNATPPTINPNVLKDTKPDAGTSPTGVQPKEGTALGNINLYQGVLALLATIVITLGGLTLIRRYVRPTNAASPMGTATKTPQANQGFIAGLLSGGLKGKARDKGGSNIRLIETMPTGNSSFIHLVEVHGKQFVVGATPWQISMLTEVGDENVTAQAEFQEILRTAAGELLSSENEAAIAMNTMDSQLRDTNSAVVQNIDRLRALRNASHSDS